MFLRRQKDLHTERLLSALDIRRDYWFKSSISALTSPAGMFHQGGRVRRALLFVCNQCFSCQSRRRRCDEEEWRRQTAGLQSARPQTGKPADASGARVVWPEPLLFQFNQSSTKCSRHDFQVSASLKIVGLHYPAFSHSFRRLCVWSEAALFAFVSYCFLSPTHY